MKTEMMMKKAAMKYVGCTEVARATLSAMAGRLAGLWLMVCLALPMNAQTTLKKVYDEQADPMEQIDRAIVRAEAEGKFVMCQVGGNWCPWCLKFADFVANDTAVAEVIDRSFVYIHVNYNPRRSAGEAQARQAAALMERLNNPARFGFPVFVVLDGEGRVLHIQDSSFLEEGQGYSRERVLRFFKGWTPEALK